MKICFLLQRKFAVLGHQLIMELKEKYGVNEFCAYVQLRTNLNFLKEQMDINYSGLLLDEDVHNTFKHEPLDLDYIKNLEKEYGFPNLWQCLAVDRIIMHGQLIRDYPYNQPKHSHEEMMRILQVQTKAIIKFLDKEKPDALILTAIGCVGAMLLYQIAKKRGITTIFITETRFENECSLSEEYSNLSWAEEIFDKLKTGQSKSQYIDFAKNYIEKFRLNPQYCPDQAGQSQKKKNSQLNKLRWLLPSNLYRSISWLIISTYRYYGNKRYLDYTQQNPWLHFLDKTRKKIRLLIGYDRYYDKENFTEDYAFFPLHYEPEIATLLYAPFWSDQINLIKQIAKSLPLHYKLYVKEHPGMIGYRQPSYYKELKKIPNVKLINQSVNSFKIIENAKLVTVITGTAGWEAVIFKKPVITFGEVFYNQLSTVKKCDQIERLPYLVKDQLENFHHDEIELENFIAAIKEVSAPVRLWEIWKNGVRQSRDRKLLNLLADLIAKKLKLTV